MQFRWVINKRYGLYREAKAVRPSVGTYRDRGGGGAGRAAAPPLFCAKKKNN